MTDDITRDPSPQALRPTPGAGWSVRPYGCLLPVLLPAGAIPVALWIAGEWAAIGLAIAAFLLGMFWYLRLDRSGAAIEHGCAAFVLVACMIALIPAVGRIRTAAERIRAERESQRIPPPSAPAESEQRK